MAAEDRVQDGEPMRRISLDNYAVAAGPRLGVKGWLRWIWRQVTSMRVALILLLLLALASIPGSLLPQWPQDPTATRGFIDEYPVVGPLLDSTGFLDVFGSAWFTAIYVLLFASLLGCIIPRTIAHYRALRAPISAAPRSLKRYEISGDVETDDAPTAFERMTDYLRPQKAWWGAFTGYRTRLDKRETRQGEQWAFAADKGHVREVGNLLFHIALVGILLSVAAGSLFMHRGQALIIEGRSFTNALVAYDSFESGSLFNPDWLSPFTLSLDSFEAEFDTRGAPAHFRANVTLTEPGQEPWATDIMVNRPLRVDDGKIYLQGNGYAPDLTFVDADGNVAHAGPVPFLPQDEAYTSEGVLKVPDVTSGEQVGIKATLLPSAIFEDDAVYSILPDLMNPVIVFSIYTGDLGLDSGIPQNVYQLDESQLSPVRDDDGDVAFIAMGPGDTVELPDELGTLSWDTTPRFVALDLRSDPSLPWLLAFSVLALLGLGMSLFGSRRRIWLLAPAVDGRTVITGAALGPAHDVALEEHLRQALSVIASKETP